MSGFMCKHSKFNETCSSLKNWYANNCYQRSRQYSGFLEMNEMTFFMNMQHRKSNENLNLHTSFVWFRIRILVYERWPFFTKKNRQKTGKHH